MTEVESHSIQDYKIMEQGKTLDKVVETMNDMVKKNNEMYLRQELSEQKIKIYTVVIGVVFNTLFLLALHFFGPDVDKVKDTAPDMGKVVYYDRKAAEDARLIQELRDELERLKRGR